MVFFYYRDITVYSLSVYSQSVIVFICTDAWAPICIFLHVSDQNESVHIKSIDTLKTIDTLY